MAPSSSHGKFVAASTKIISFVCIRPSIYNHKYPCQEIRAGSIAWKRVIFRNITHSHEYDRESQTSTCISNSVFNRRLASCSLLPSPRWLMMESISSRNIVDGAWCLASSNRTLTSFSESPVHTAQMSYREISLSNAWNNLQAFYTYINFRVHEIKSCSNFIWLFNIRVRSNESFLRYLGGHQKYGLDLLQ